MRVTNGELENAKTALIYVGETNGSLSAGNKRLFDYISDLLEARELIKEMREDLLKISQYPIDFVCEEARIIAREAWKKSMEVTE